MKELQEAIVAEARVVEEFLAALQEEEKALVRADAALLPGITERKNQAIERLNAMSNLRNAYLKALGHAPDKEGMQAWLKQLPQTSNADQTVKTWHELLDVARQCREINSSNGHLINMHLIRTQQAMTALSHKRTPTLVYGPKGQTSGLTGYRLIDSA